MAVSRDALAQGRAYQRQLLALLGKDDAAGVMELTEPLLRSILNDAGSDLRKRPQPSEWSVLELLGHLVDAEMVMSGRYRWTVSQEQPPLLGYDQDQWVARLRHNDDQPEELLAIFSALRAANLRLWRRSSADDRQRVAMHGERGPESYDLMFRMLAGHDRFHLNQMRETLRQLRAVS
jgi:hypothetical protein